MRQSAMGRAGQITVIVLAILISGLNLLKMTGHGGYIHMLQSYRSTMEIWQWLSLWGLILAVIGISGAWLNIYRKRPLRAVVCLALTLPAPLIIEANRCDYGDCRALSWLVLQPGAAEKAEQHILDLGEIKGQVRAADDTTVAVDLRWTFRRDPSFAMDPAELPSVYLSNLETHFEVVPEGDLPEWNNDEIQFQATLIIPTEVWQQGCWQTHHYLPGVIGSGPIVCLNQENSDEGG